MPKIKKDYPIKYLMNPSCRFFNGYSPCPKALENGQVCPTKDCIPVGKRLLIIEMGGLGSVLRTTAVAKEYKEKNKSSQVTFLTNSEGTKILRFSPYIDIILSDDLKNLLTLVPQEFDDIFNFEINEIARSMATMIRSKNKYGFGMNNNGLPRLINPVSADLFRFQIDNSFRQKNKKSIQQLLLESVGMEWKEQKYEISLREEDVDFSNSLMEKYKIKGPIIGLNIGTKKKHARKRWPTEQFITLAKELKVREITPLILAGPEEKEIFQYTMKKLKKLEIYGIYFENMGKFLAVLSKCDVVVSATTFGLISAIGLGVKTVSICSPKPVNEICDYGNGIMIAMDDNYDPKYSTKIYGIKPKEELKIGLKGISVEVVLDAVKNALNDDLTNPVRYMSKTKS